MPNSTHLYGQLFDFLRQYSRASDLRHHKALAWMVSALVCSGQLSLPAWEPYVPSRATKAQSVERRWQRFMNNARIRVERLYVPLVLASLSGWKAHRLYLAMDTTVLWDRALHDSPVRGLLWTGSAVVVASARTRQCNGSLQGIQGAVTKSQMAVAPSPGCHAVGRPWQCPPMS